MPSAWPIPAVLAGLWLGVPILLEIFVAGEIEAFKPTSAHVVPAQEAQGVYHEGDYHGTRRNHDSMQPRRSPRDPSGPAIRHR